VDRETRERRDRLLEQVTTHPAVRNELAELYRELGHVDQAGRWGISVEGWTRNRERDAYIALIKQQRPDAERMLRRLSGLGPREPLTADAAAVIAEASRLSTRSSPVLHGWRAQLDFWSRWTSGPVAAMGAGVFVLMLLAMFAAAFSGAEDLTMPARLTATVVALSLALAATFRLPASILRKQWIRVALLVIVAVALGTVFAILASSPGFRLPGEG